MSVYTLRHLQPLLKAENNFVVLLSCSTVNDDKILNLVCLEYEHIISSGEGLNLRCISYHPNISY